ncbi:hypothetical protein PDE_01833 [Penicillium oxalicum 114-2]|uniref:Uncharacterized protein n=1 Tax=Penicillium oxalicum (strain 114-2 / CGMCC 5302) TaxID=933388 RepID=S8AM07_PENO1|nr:hypothetical protein PDE_01833 [Penicillium oxalicum 114-2]
MHLAPFTQSSLSLSLYALRSLHSKIPLLSSSTLHWVYFRGHRYSTIRKLHGHPLVLSTQSMDASPPSCGSLSPCG